MKYKVKINIYGIDPLAKFDFCYSKKKNIEAKRILIRKMINNNILGSNIYYAMYGHEDKHFKKYKKIFIEAIKEISKSMQL